MAKEVMIYTAEQVANIEILPEAVDAYKFALANAGVEMDEETERHFIAQRNEKVFGFTELKRTQSEFEKCAASIKDVLKHTFNCGTEDDLPSNVKWSKQSYTYEFAEGAGSGIANDLVEKNLTTINALLATITPTTLAKACGITIEKLADMYPDCIIFKPKERTLTIK